jgi:hypothetical protein
MRLVEFFFLYKILIDFQQFLYIYFEMGCFVLFCRFFVDVSIQLKKMG